MPYALCRVCVRSPGYPACKVHVPYHTVIRPSLVVASFHIISSVAQFSEHKMCVLTFATTSV